MAAATDCDSPWACGIVFAHESLEIGKFTDHLRDQIGFAQFGGTARFAAVSADMFGNGNGQILQAQYPARHQPQLFVENNVSQAFACELSSFDFAILLPEKTSI